MGRQVKEVPDGGWGWVVVFGVALTNVVNQSLLSLFGLLYGEVIMQMGHSTVGVALVMNINTMVTNFSGFITGPVLKNYSPRVVAFTGVLLSSSGLILSSYATNIIYLILSYSILVGLGFGLIMPSTFLAVNSYFSRRRSQAVGLSMAGTGIGQMLMPQVVRFLLDEYGYRGATLIMGALSLHGLVGSLLFQPVAWHMKIANTEEEEERIGLLSNIKIPNKQSANLGKEINETKSEEQQHNISENIWKRIVNTLDLELLKDPVFVHIIIGLGIVYTSNISFSMLFPFYLEDIGLDREKTTLSMSLLSAADIIGRLTIPLIATRLQLGNRITFLYGAVMIGLCRSLLAVQSTLGGVLAASVLCGYIRASVVINQNLTVSEYCDEKKLPAALGLHMVSKGLVVLTLGQFLGWVRDYTNSYSICIFIQSSFTVLVSFSWACEIVIRKLLDVPTS